jgi:hypothetical protein
METDMEASNFSQITMDTCIHLFITLIQKQPRPLLSLFTESNIIQCCVIQIDAPPVDY